MSSFKSKPESRMPACGKSTAARLIALAMTAQASFAQTPALEVATAQMVVPPPAVVDLDHQFSAQRQFVFQTSAQLEANLNLILTEENDFVGQQLVSDDAPGLFAIRIGEFAEAQGALVADYSQRLRMRRIEMSEGVKAFAEDRSLLFFETGVMVPASEGIVETPLLSFPPSLFGPAAPFPGLASLRGGFFALTGQ